MFQFNSWLKDRCTFKDTIDKLTVNIYSDELKYHTTNKTTLSWTYYTSLWS